MSADTALQSSEHPAHTAVKHNSNSPSGSPVSIVATASGDAAGTSTTINATDIRTDCSFYTSPIAGSPSYHPPSSTSSLDAKPEVSSSAPSSMESSATTSTLVDLEPDALILEALRSKDRIYVLKLGEQMEALIKERRTRIDLTPSTSYQRLLVHRCSAFYKLSPEADPASKGIFVYHRSESRIPPRRICELVPAEESAQPAFQIMRRLERPLRGRQYSHPGSSAGDDADTSDVDASEAGSVGGVSSAASTHSRRFKTIEEREAEYNEARSRIFMGFEDKKEKDKDMSANSSTFSLVSGSGSTSGGRGSSIGDLDDSASSAPTESEWSGPVARDKRETRKGAGSTASSVRSLRSSGPSYATGSGSSRNSRATSPSFTYPTLYEPALGPTYDQQPQFSGPPQPPTAPRTGYVGPYVYHPYSSPPPPPPPSHGQPYAAPYYYPAYPYPPPPPHHSESTPGGPQAMYSPPPNTGQHPQYGPPYMWTPSPPGQPLPPPHIQHPPPPTVAPGHADGHVATHPMPPPMQGIPTYHPYSPGYGYNIPGYFQQPYQPSASIGPPPPMYHPGPVPEANSHHHGNGNGLDGLTISRTSSRNSMNNHSLNGKRSAPRPRGSWTYGPGVGVGGFPCNPGSPNGVIHDAYGPRLSIPMRRTSASSGGSAGARPPADETSSTASSSTTSSSSRHTFTSTSTSPPHPLPARPDWAVGLRVNPRHNHHNNGSTRNAPGGSRQLTAQPPQSQSSDSSDFPPLSSGPSTRQPVVGGAWTNASTSRVMMPGPQGNTHPQATVLVHYPTSQQSSPQALSAPPPGSFMRLDEQDSAFERPPPKNAELFNPKAAGRNGPRMENGGSRANMGTSTGGLVDRMGSMVLIDTDRAMDDPSIMSSRPGTGDTMFGTTVGETLTASS